MVTYAADHSILATDVSMACNAINAYLKATVNGSMILIVELAKIQGVVFHNMLAFDTHARQLRAKLQK